MNKEGPSHLISMSSYVLIKKKKEKEKKKKKKKKHQKGIYENLPEILRNSGRFVGSLKKGHCMIEIE
jgi:hypothetical protein